MATQNIQRQSVKVDDLEIAYREYGTANQPTLVLLHGMAETSVFFWNNLITALGSEYRIIAFDLIGHGGSARPFMGYSAANQARLYHEVLKQLNVQSCVLMGHSLGGIVGATLAIKYPQLVTKLVLYDTPVPAGPIGNIPLSVKMRLLSVLAIVPLGIPGIGLIADGLSAIKLLPKKFILKATLKTWRVPYHAKNATDAFFEQAVDNSFFSLEQHMRFLFLFYNLEKQLPQLKAPTLILIGEADVLVPTSRAKQLQGIIPNARLEIIPEAGHVSLIDQPQVFIDRLRSFLA